MESQEDEDSWWFWWWTGQNYCGWFFYNNSQSKSPIIIYILYLSWDLLMILFSGPVKNTPQLLGFPHDVWMKTQKLGLCPNRMVMSRSKGSTFKGRSPATEWRCRSWDFVNIATITILVLQIRFFALWVQRTSERAPSVVSFGHHIWAIDFFGPYSIKSVPPKFDSSRPKLQMWECL